MSMRSAASWCHPLQERVVPVGAVIGAWAREVMPGICGGGGKDGRTEGREDGKTGGRKDWRTERQDRGTGGGVSDCLCTDRVITRRVVADRHRAAECVAGRSASPWGRRASPPRS